MKKEELKNEIELSLEGPRQTGIFRLKRDLNRKGVQFSGEELAAAVGSLFLEGRIDITYCL